MASYISSKVNGRSDAILAASLVAEQRCGGDLDAKVTFHGAES
jgi:hypothetical protein